MAPPTSELSRFIMEDKEECGRKYHFTYCKKMKEKNTTLSDQFQKCVVHTIFDICIFISNCNSKFVKGAKSTPLTHIHDHPLFWLGTATSIKCGGVKGILWTQTSPLGETI